MTVNGTGLPIVVPAEFVSVIVPVQDSFTGVVVVADVAVDWGREAKLAAESADPDRRDP